MDDTHPKLHRHKHDSAFPQHRAMTQKIQTAKKPEFQRKDPNFAGKIATLSQI